MDASCSYASFNKEELLVVAFDKLYTSSSDSKIASLTPNEADGDDDGARDGDDDDDDDEL